MAWHYRYLFSFFYDSELDLFSISKRKIEEIENENQRMKEDLIFKICWSNQFGVVFLPCGHLISCVNCSPKHKDFPFCRQFIKRKIKTFFNLFLIIIHNFICITPINHWIENIIFFKNHISATKWNRKILYNSLYLTFNWTTTIPLWNDQRE